MIPKPQHRYTVYILGSSSGTLYIGMTSDLVARVRQHQDHTFGGFTEKYDVTRLLYYEVYGRAADAIGREKQLQGWRREKKIALIEKANPQWRDLSREWDELRLRTKRVETFDEV
jgi:predicted GIY-YIG superfamily endonuclease